MPPRRDIDPEELLPQVGWVRALARELVRDPNAADDLAQDALVVALSGSGGSGERPRSVRRWLAGVVRNLVRTSRRGERRRAEREAAAVRGGVSPPALELVERAATQRALVGAVLELAEPYRTTLLMRFFEDRSARSVAAELGVPESTVATRTAEGLRRLRRRLARGDAGGDGRGWLPSILPLLRWPRSDPSTAAATGALAVSLPKILTASGGLVAVALFVHLATDGARPSTPEGGGARLLGASTEAPGASAGGASRDLAPPRGEEPARTAEVEPLPEDLVPRGADPAVRGRVIDLTGAPVVGVEVVEKSRFGPLAGVPRDAHHAALLAAAEREPARVALTDADGEFVLEGAPPHRLRVRSERYATVFEGAALPGRDVHRPIVVVAPRIPVAGEVVGADGAPVAGATVALVAPGRLLELAGEVLDESSRVTPRGRTDDGGAFELREAADLAGAVLQASAPGHLTATVPVPEGGARDLRIVLERPATGKYVVTGRVRAADGSPAEGALVSAGWVCAAADAGGFFVLDLEPGMQRFEREDPLVLRAVRRGALPASRPLPSIAEAEQRGWPPEVVLELGGAPLSIRGRVVDQRGRPLRDVVVEPLDVTELGLVMNEREGWGTLRSVEEIAGGGETRTDADGAFVLGGLQARAYRIAAMEERSLLWTVVEPVEAGTDGVTIVLDRSGLGRIAGRIVDRDGTGVPGVRVAVSRERRTQLAIGIGATTDAEGAFVLEGVTTEPELLRLEGEAIVPELFRELPAGVDRQALELAVARRCYLQVDWGDWEGRADELSIVAAGDRPLELVALEGGRVGIRTALEVTRGLSEVFAVSDAATHAVLGRGDEEVTRFRLRLTPGQVELLRL